MIKLSNLSKYYYSGNSVALGLRKVNLEFFEKEFVVITGESGSGKTTLLSTISGLLPYEEGELYIEDKPTSHFDEDDWESYRKEYIAFVFQNYNLIDSYTVLENVMAVLLIQGISKKEAKQIALEYLGKVGLTDYITHHASELSSGQKQRLSIARALAKNTKIIVADEPTGNLDAENGRQVMELLSKLAEDRLVLVVTHNYEEAAPFATRKVRIYDGEVVEDIQIRKEKQVEVAGMKETPEAAIAKANTADVAAISSKKISLIFTKMELCARKKRGVLFTSLLFFVAIATFLFMGNVLATLDDTFTRIYTNEAFSNIDELRIAVRHEDGSEITDADLEIFKQIENVDEVEQYGLSNDIYYFCEEGKDYTVNIVHTNAGFDNENENTFESVIYLEKYEKFVRSASGLTEEDLACGTLPQNANDVVIYTEDDSLLGTTFTCFFCDEKNWMKNAYCRLEMTICGILQEETSQYYFSEDVAKMLSISAYENAQGLYAIDRVVNCLDEDGARMAWMNGDSKLWQETIFYTDSTYETENPYQVVVSSELLSRAGRAVSFSIALQQGNENEWTGYEFLYVLNEVHSGGDLREDSRLEGVGEIAETPHLSSPNFTLVSKQVFDEMTAEFYSPQASIYVTDYAYADDVMKALNDAGYEVVSPYRIGAIAYDDAKVTERLITLGLSLAALIVLLVLEVFILKALLKNGTNDCLILKSVGMEQQILGRVQRNTLVCYGFVAFVLMLGVAVALNQYVPQVHALVVYYRIYHWVILLGLNLGAILFTAFLHNRYLKQLLVAGIE